MNVWLVFPRFKMPTGAERFILGLARGLVERGHAATVVTHEFDPRCRALVAPGVMVHASGRDFAWTGNHYLDSAVRYLAGAALPLSLPAAADVAVFFAAASVPALAVQRARGKGTRAFYFCFEPPRFAYRDREAILARLGGVARAVIGPLARTWAWLDRRLVRCAERVLVFGPFIEAQVRELYPEAAVARVTPCVDVPAARLGRAEVRSRLGAGDAPVLLTVNFLHPRKRVDLFLAAVAEVATRHPDVIGVVVGEGPERARLEALAARLGIGERVRFAGFVPDEELGSWYRMASVYLHTAHDESFGLTVLEAGSSGVPVVAVREGGVCETLDDGVTALLVDATPDALADGVMGVLDDRARAARLAGEAAERLPARFSHERMIDELLVALR
ncbi:MAG: glycosyltransferase family 4 protein [Deltaproteobacteria bacterium]|nr:glycosyltransferase family 4 protein [Deltaproteobacteria bacterium]